MIFCFSGTGNSLYAAKRIAESTDDKIMEICEDNINDTEYNLENGERLGFIMPTYWGSMPKIAEKFIRNLKFNNVTNNYVYVVGTYGINECNIVKDVTKLLRSKGIIVKGGFAVKMVDNYVVAYDIADKEKQQSILNDAEKEITEAVKCINDRKSFIKENKSFLSFVSPVSYKLYKTIDHTKKFYADDKCVGCSMCEKNCPCNVITVSDGKVTWDGDCSFCLKCINTCPKESIQFGKKTVKRRRYKNPNL